MYKSFWTTGVTALAIGVGAVGAAWADEPAQPEEKAEKVVQTEETETQKTSYALGFNFGQQLAGDDIPLDVQRFVDGLEAALAGEEGDMTADEIQQTLMNLQRQLQMKQMQQMQEQGQENVAKGAAFLEANKAKEGVKVTESGLQYKVVEAGEGASPKADDTVVVHYTGTLIDGTKFDSSRDRGQPAEFQVNRVISGWTEALQMMKPGDKWELYIPADLAYGAQGRPPVIPPSSTLVFEVELLEVKPADGQ